MRRVLLVLAVLFLLAGAGSAAMAQVATPGPASPQATPQPSPRPDLTGVEPSPLIGDRRDAFEAYVASALQRHGVPGAAVAVIQGGRTVYLQGFGVKEIGGNEPVTPDTLMMIGSINKSMTSAMSAALVDDGRLSWDTPVVGLLPDFAVADPQLTPRLTVADAFCACTGLPRRDLEIVFNTLDPGALIDSMDELPLTAPFGERFQYSNQMYAVGGYAAAVEAGAAPEDPYAGYVAAMQNKVLGPIGMVRSTFVLEDVLSSGNYALPHGIGLDGQTQQLPVLGDVRFASSVAPAGALWSSARDMARYIQTQMNDGLAPDDVRVISAENLARTRTPRVATPALPDGLPAVLTEASTHYAMGWLVGEWRGLTLVHHDGGTFGFASEAAFLPEADLGIVVLTNGIQGGAFNLDVEFRLFELLFDQAPEFGPLVAQFLGAQAAQIAQLQAQLRPIDPVAVAPYLGRYASPALGEADLTLQDGRLIFDAGEVRSEVRPVADQAGQTVAYVFTDPPLAGPTPITLQQGPSGQPEIVLMLPGEDAAEPLVYVFTQAQPAPTATPTPPSGSGY
jgi:CubicO group peptidase (beta-lactamase class C family)